MDLFEAFIFGVVEGFTEFLPVSSTGHLILLSKLMEIPQTKSLDLWLRLAVAFVPTGLLGLLLYKHIKALFDAQTVVIMLVLGGIVFILVEYFHKEKDEHLDEPENMSFMQAFMIGLAQSLAMIPGTSRSGATILGGIFLGLKRKAAVEFSFLLALPTMAIATAYDIYKNYALFNVDSWGVLAVGFISAFVFAVIAIRTFLAVISRFNFIPFGLYRIALGGAFYLYIL